MVQGIPKPINKPIERVNKLEPTKAKAACPTNQEAQMTRTTQLATCTNSHNITKEKCHVRLASPWNPHVN